MRRQALQQWSRRGVIIAGAAMLAGCGAGGAGTPRVAPGAEAVPAHGGRPGVACLGGGVSRPGAGPGDQPCHLRGSLDQAGFTPGVIERDRNHTTNSRRSLEDYLALVANEARVAEGRAALAAQRTALTAIATRYGVPSAGDCGLLGRRKPVWGNGAGPRP